MNAATLRILIAKGLSPEDLIAVAEAMEVKRDPTNAERQARFRAKKRPRNTVTVTPFPPIEEDHTPVSPSLDKSNDCPPFAEKVVSDWNAGAGTRGLATARKLDPSRAAKLRLRVKEQGEDGVLEAIKRIQASDFHCGLKAGSDWKVNLGWLLKSAENMGKALDLPPCDDERPAKPADPNAGKSLARYQAGEISFEEFDRTRRESEPRRTSSTGPPRPIGQLLPRLATG